MQTDIKKRPSWEERMEVYRAHPLPADFRDEMHKRGYEPSYQMWFDCAEATALAQEAKAEALAAEAERKANK